jgi:hypothetical protein
MIMIDLVIFYVFLCVAIIYTNALNGVVIDFDDVSFTMFLI